MIRVEVHTFKAGLLAAAGHDLALLATRASERIDEARVDVDVDAASLIVEGTLRDGRVNANELSPSERGEIEANIRDRVLECARHPTIRFRSSDVHRVLERDVFRVSGELTLKGTTRPLCVDVSRRVEGDEEHLVARFTLHQPDFGIRPFRALLGALAIKPDVEVTVTVARPLA